MGTGGIRKLVMSGVMEIVAPESTITGKVGPEKMANGQCQERRLEEQTEGFVDSMSKVKNPESF